MSLTSDAPALPGTGRTPLWRRLGLMLAAVAIIAAVMGLVGLWLGPLSKPPPRNPFGMGLREATPSGSLGAWILSVQSGFYGSLQAGVREMKENGSALFSLLLVGFAYGVFHAAGPGHGKGVISAYLVADEKALRKGFALSLAAALVQALVAIGIVAIVSLALRATASTMNKLALNVELASFIAVALLGAVITWRKAGKVLGVMALARNPYAAVEENCDHVHMPPPEELSRLTRWRDMAGVAIAAGIRPVAGALRGRHRGDFRHGARHGTHHRRHRGARGLLQGHGFKGRRRTRGLRGHRHCGPRTSGGRLRAGAGSKPPLRPLGGRLTEIIAAIRTPFSRQGRPTQCPSASVASPSSEGGLPGTRQSIRP
jgi:nickel/cobalt transporter (NicO) family protein